MRPETPKAGGLAPSPRPSDLAPEALADLRAATQAIDVRILERDLGGRTVRLVLAGEQHYDSSERLAYTLPVLRWFPDRALETTRETAERFRTADLNPKERERIRRFLRQWGPDTGHGLSHHAYSTEEHPPRKLIFLEREEELGFVIKLLAVDLLSGWLSLKAFYLGLVLAAVGAPLWALDRGPGRGLVLTGGLLVFSHLLRRGLADLDESGRLRLSRYLPDSLWIACLGTWTHQAVSERDGTMSGRLTRAFAEDPELTELLAVVGKAHVPGMLACLRRDHGWVERPWRPVPESGSDA